MITHLKSIGASAPALTRTVIVSSALVFPLSGCAAGRTDDGSILIGAKVAELPETMEQAAKLAAGALPEPWGTLAKAAIGLVFGGSAAAYAARRAKQREDHAWDEAEARATGRLRAANERAVKSAAASDLYM